MDSEVKMDDAMAPIDRELTEIGKRLDVLRRTRERLAEKMSPAMRADQRSDQVRGADEPPNNMSSITIRLKQLADTIAGEIDEFEQLILRLEV